MGLRAEQAARRLITHAIAGNVTLAVAESLTGGCVASTIVSIPGTSQVFRGGVVAYHTDAKRDLLGVSSELLADVGPIDPRVAAEMAERVRELFAVDGEPALLGLATTGVAGPAEQDGHPAGEVYIAVSSVDGTRVQELWLEGSRDEIRDQAVAAVLELGATVLADRGDSQAD